jgi:rod shape-determining protein MreC
MFLIARHRNLSILATVLLAQMLGLAFQVKRPTDHGPTRLIRIWAMNIVSPLEQVAEHAKSGVTNLWSDYLYLRDVRRENESLRQENLHLRLEQVRLAQDAGQAQRLQALLAFKEQFISATIAAQVIGTSGTDGSHVIYVDKGAQDGIKGGMAVITPAGIVGKVITASAATSQVLEINDQQSGVGALLEKSRLQGIVKGSPAGETVVHYVMSDEKVEPGEIVVTSGGDGVFPKGLTVGAVTSVSAGPESFLNIRVKPAAQLDRLEEVLVILTIEKQQPELVTETPLRAADILAQRLPGVPVKPPEPQSSSVNHISPPLADATRSGSPSRSPAVPKPEAASATNRRPPDTLAEQKKIQPQDNGSAESH